MERLGRFFGAFLSVMLFMGIYSIAEEITLTTYYPAPYGAYNELSVSQQQEKAVGELKTSALTVLSTTDDTETMPLISASTKLNGMLLDSEDATDSYYILNIRAGEPLTSKFYVRADGNVGIGTAVPTTALDVNGTINATSYSTTDGAVGVTTGTFLTADLKTVTVKNGIIVSITGP
jgi:hypothetical protein